MSKIGIFYGSTTGNTEMVAQELQKLLGEDVVDLHDVESADKLSINDYDCLLFGIPTWDIGQLQEDWEDWLDHLKDSEVELKGKKAAIFGVGDQEGYPDTFGDAMKAIYDILLERGTTVICDQWSKEGYEFEDSLAIKNDKLIGMMIDEDSQPELTGDRIKQYAELLKKEFLQ
jgi:flavodoxin I